MLFGSNNKDQRIFQLEKNISDLMEEKESLIKQMDEHKQTIHSFMNVKNVYELEKTKLMKQHENEMGQLKQQIETEKQSVARKVNQELASIGVTKFALEDIAPGDNWTNSPEMIFRKFNQMIEGPDKQAFFKTHEKTLSQFSGLR